MAQFNPFYNAYSPELLAYEHAWVKFIKTGTTDIPMIKKEIIESWLDCGQMGINPLQIQAPPIINQSELNKRIEENQHLLDIALPFMEILFNLTTNFRVDFIDKDGYILVSLANEKITDSCLKSNSFPGANRSIATAGTTSSGLALLHKKPFQLTGAEHYLQLFHRWTCSAAPMCDELGNIIGVINMAGRCETNHPHTLGMVSAVAKAIENELKIKQKNVEIINNHNQLKATLEAVSDGLIYVDNNGIITQVNFVMEEVLGIQSNNIIGKKIEEVIKTTPNLNNNFSINHQSIILHGNNRNFSGYLRSKTILGKNNKKNGTVFIFTKAEEISKMVSKMHKNDAYFTFENIIGQDIKLWDAIYLAKKAAEFDSRVIIEGESGTGKEIFAQAIHNASKRKHRPFVAVNCGAIPRELIESELFGYDEGSFTGAKKGGQIGKFEIADGGTVFLDEIGDMPIEMQVKILRVLQENRILRIGGKHPIPINVRVIAATNKDLEEEVEKQNFRKDLFFRLNVFRIKIPALRERKNDIPALVNYFIENYGNKDKKVSREAMDILKKYSWPGNVRQLQNVVERTLALANESSILAKHLPNEILQEATNSPAGIYLDKIIPLEDFSRQYVLNTLAVLNNNITEASKLLNISRTTVYKFIGKGASQNLSNDN